MIKQDFITHETDLVNILCDYMVVLSNKSLQVPYKSGSLCNTTRSVGKIVDEIKL